MSAEAEAYREPYKYGFVTPIENDSFEKGLNEDIIRRASKIRKEPEFMLKFRLNAYEKLLQMQEPRWAELKFAPVNLQDIVYYSAPKTKKSHDSIADVDPELLETCDKLGIPLDEQKRLANVAVDYKHPFACHGQDGGHVARNKTLALTGGA